MIRNLTKKLNSDLFLLPLIAFFVLMTRLQTLSQPLVERHDFRQTQTAFQTLTLARGEGSLLHPKLPIFGSPWELPFEFPLFQWIASWIYRVSNLSLDSANRVTSLVFFIMCLLPLFAICRNLMSRFASYCVLLLFSFSPFALQWSRASLIEYCALFFALTFSWYCLRSWQSPTVTNSFLLMSFGIVAGLVKATTLAPMMLFSGLLIVLHLETASTLLRKRRSILVVGIPSAVSLVIARMWTSWADQIRLDNPATAWMSEEKLKPWMYGTVEQRKVAANWSVIIDRIDQLLLGQFSIIVIFLLIILIPKIRRRLLASTLPVFVTISVLFNLYVVHDYYLVAVSALIVISFGVALDGFASTAAENRGQWLIVGLTTAAVLIGGLVLQRGYWKVAYQKFNYPTSELSQVSTPRQYAFTSYGGWNPVLLYYADRRGMMLDPRSTTVEYLRTLPDLDRYDFYYGAPDRPEVIQIRNWYLPVGSQTTRIDNDADDFQKWGLAIGMLGTPTESPNRFESISCDGAKVFDLTQVEPGRSVWLKSEGSNTLSFVSGLQAVPVGARIQVLNKIDADQYGKVSCAGGGTVSLEWTE